MMMSDIYGLEFCMDYLEEFMLHRFDYIKLEKEQKDLLKFNKDKDHKINSFVKLDIDLYEDNVYLFNDEKLKYIEFKLDNYALAEEDKSFCIFYNIEKGLKFYYDISELNKVFLLKDKEKLIINHVEHNLIEGKKYEFRVRENEKILKGVYKDKKLTVSKPYEIGVNRKGMLGLIEPYDLSVDTYELYMVLGVKEIN